eukprot:9388502-Pyramimonas_sp.AAC.1
MRAAPPVQVQGRGWAKGYALPPGEEQGLKEHPPQTTYAEKSGGIENRVACGWVKSCASKLLKLNA